MSVVQGAPKRKHEAHRFAAWVKLGPRPCAEADRIALRDRRSRGKLAPRNLEARRLAKSESPESTSPRSGAKKPVIAASNTFVEQKLESPLKPLLWLLLPMVLLVLWGIYSG